MVAKQALEQEKISCLKLSEQGSRYPNVNYPSAEDRGA